MPLAPAGLDGPAAAAAAPAKPSMLFLVGSLAVGNYVSLGLRMIGGVLQARFVAPSVLGLFNSIGLVMAYVPFLQLGILNGLSRELPYFIGKGDRRRVNELAAAGQAWALLVGALVGLVLLGVAVWQLTRGDLQMAAGWFTYAVFAVLFFYNSLYLQLTYRTSHDFARLALASVVENAVALLLVALVALLSFYGLCLRALLTALVSVMFLYHWRPVRVSPAWNWQRLKHLLIIGAPLFGVGQLYALWTALNPTLVLHYAGTEGMGLYSMAILAGTTLDLLPMAVLQVTYPRMAEQYGRTHNVHELIGMTWKPILLTAGGMIPTIAVAWWLAAPMVRLLVPAYVAAVPAIQWSLLVPFVTAFHPINSVFNVVRRQDLYATAMLLGMASYGGSLMWLTRGGVSLVAFPQAMLIGRAVFVLACYPLVGYLRSREGFHGG